MGKVKIHFPGNSKQIKRRPLEGEYEMGGLVLFMFYGGIVFFLVASVYRGIKYASAPLHANWDLYSTNSIYALT